MRDSCAGTEVCALRLHDHRPRRRSGRHTVLLCSLCPR